MAGAGKEWARSVGARMNLGFVFIILYVLASGGQMCLNKAYQSHVKSTLIAHNLYLLVMSFLAAICFYVLAGFNLAADRQALLLAFLACFTIVLQQVSTLVCMARVNLTMVTVSSNAGMLLWPTLFGLIFLREEISIFGVIGILLTLAAFLVPFVFNASEMKRDRSTQKSYLLCALLFLVSGHTNSIHKVFTASRSIASDSSYLSWINIFMFPMVLLAFFILTKKARKPLREQLKGIDFRYYGFVAAGTVVGCFGMLFSFQALARLDVSLYSPLYSSVYIVFLTLASRFLFKEKLKKENYISVALAVASVVFSSL